MDDQQRERHWQTAQRLDLGVDLISAARSQLRLLAAVDSHPLGLYAGPALDLAISRYENQWLPLLMEHGPYTSFGLPLVPPLDCAWIWHCHRLNPVQYIKDCETTYGKLLNPAIVPIAVESKSIVHTQHLWELQFPDEDYDLPSQDLLLGKSVGSRKLTYDLHAAVQRQSSFFYQVSRPYMEDERFLNAALQRYKGFLYLLKLSKLCIFLVPTYDIDLMWHSHQAYSEVYRDDTVKLLGSVLNHDDTDSDRAVGQKLDTGLNKTRKLWHLTFGFSYEKAGSMYRGEPPTSLPLSQWTQNMESWQKNPLAVSSFHPNECVEQRKSIQVFIRVFEARNLHVSHNGVEAVRVLFKRKCSMLKFETSWLKLQDNIYWDAFSSFDCETSTEGLRLELHIGNEGNPGLIKKSSLIGWTDLSWQTLLSSPTLSLDGWMPLIMESCVEKDQKPTSLRVSVSITPPYAAPLLFQMDHPLSKSKSSNSLFKRIYNHRLRTSFIVEFKDSSGGKTWQPSSIQIYAANARGSSGNLLGSADCIQTARNVWRLLDGDMFLSIPSKSTSDQPNAQLLMDSNALVMLMHGNKCQYELPGSRHTDEAGYMTLFRRSQGASVGKATALFNWKSGSIEVSPDENIILVILLCAIMGIEADRSHVTSCNLKPLYKLKKTTDNNDWGAVTLNNHAYFCGKNLLWFYPWYTMTSKQWLGMLYKAESDCSNGGLLSFLKLCCGSCGCESCDRTSDGMKFQEKGCDCFLETPKYTPTQEGGRCTRCTGSSCQVYDTAISCYCAVEADKKGFQGGNCGGCSAGGGGDSLSKADLVAVASECGSCGAGGCGNSLSKANLVAVAGGCGACGAGGCGNSVSKANMFAIAGGCGACGAGGCGNSLSKANMVAKAGGCGACGAGGCGNSVSKANMVAIAGGCGACGAGGCGNSLSKANMDAIAGGCGACGAGGCGNSVSKENMVAKADGCGNSNANMVVHAGGCGACGAGGCGNSLLVQALRL